MHKFWMKYKWYLITAVGVIALIVLYAFNLNDDFEKELNGWLIDKKSKVIEEDLAYRREKIDQTDDKIEEVDTTIEKIKEKRKQDSEAVDRMDLKEMKDAWKKLGY